MTEEVLAGAAETAGVGSIAGLTMEVPKAGDLLAGALDAGTVV